MIPSNAVVHLELRFNRLSLAVGTGVIYRRDSKFYIVTAWHNVSGRHSETLECLSEHLAVPNNCLATIALTEPNSHMTFRGSFVIRLEDSDKALYLVHPEGYPRKDVAIIPIDPDALYDVEWSSDDEDMPSGKMPIALPAMLGGKVSLTAIQDFEQGAEQVVDQFIESVDFSDELFIPGYPKGITDFYFQPVWKRATVASSVNLGWDRQRKFLVDCASKQGMSGAPTLFYSRSGTVKFHGTTYLAMRPIAIFMGVYVGRVGSTDEFEAQVGTVWHRKIVDEIIDAGVWGVRSENMFASSAEIREAIEQYRLEDPENWGGLVLANNGGYRDRLVAAVMTLLNGRVSPTDVEEEALAFAGEQSGKT